MRFSLNGWSSKLDFDDVQLMTVSELKIKLAAIYTESRYEQRIVTASVQGTDGITKNKPAFLWSRNTTGLI